MSILVVSAMLLFATAISLSTVETTAQYDTSYCQGKRDEMTSRWEQWATAWTYDTIDPGGQIRAEGEQLSTEIGLTLVNCDTSLSDSDKVHFVH